MRRRNWRVILSGFVLIILALGFYLFMLIVASQSTDPVALMQTVGTVSGVVGGISLIMIIMGLVGKKGLEELKMRAIRKWLAFFYPIRSTNHYTAAGIFSSSSTMRLNTSKPPCQNLAELTSIR